MDYGDPPARPRRNASARAGGFTLVEMLIVIGIIITLIGILMPMVNKSYRYADRARTFADLQAIGVALEAYKADHKDYPRPTGNDGSRGAKILCRALIAPGANDGNAGTGFRVRAQGPVHGPYLQADKFRLRDPADLNNANPNLENVVMCDRSTKPILYYPASPAARVLTTPGGYVGPENRAASPPLIPLYNFADNSAWFTNLSLMRVMLGDIPPPPPPDQDPPPPLAQPDGVISDTETPAWTGPFILWSAGPDEVFGPTADIAGPTHILTIADVAKCDDVTNFNMQ